MTGGISCNYSYLRFAYANPYRQAIRANQQAGSIVAAHRPADPQTPVEPVPPVVPVYSVSSDEASNVIPFLRKGVDPVEMAVRMRIQYVDEEQVNSPSQKDILSQTDSSMQTDSVSNAQKILDEAECQTCQERRYQDGSNDPGVSFKTPTHISPEEAPAAVRGHEQEHVVRERAEAEREEREVISQSVRLHTDICPECGKVYISGGVTTTTTAAEDEPERAVENAANMGFFAVA